MKLMRRTMLMCIVFVLMFSLLVFADSWSWKSAAEPYKGTTLNYISLRFPFSQAIEPLIPEFEKETGINVELELYGQNAAFQKISFELASGGNYYDVVSLQPFLMPQYMDSGWLLPLDKYVEDSTLTDKDIFDVSDFFRSSWKAMHWDGKLYALPNFSATQVLYYNSQIFNELGISPPETYREFWKICEIIKNSNKTDVAPIALRANPNIGGNLWPFIGFLRGFGGSIYRDFPKDMTPVLEKEESIKAAEFFANLIQNFGPEGNATADWTDVLSMVREGKAAMLIDGHPLAGLLFDKERSKIANVVNVAKPPEGPAGLFPASAEHGLGIPKNSKNKEAAWLFVQWLTSKSTQLKATLNNTHLAVTRYSVIQDSKFKTNNDYANGKFISLVNELKSNTTIYHPLHPEYPEIADEIAKALSKIIVGSATAEEAFTLANQKIYTILAKSGKL